MTKPEVKPKVALFEELTERTAARLRAVCSAMSKEEFSALVTDIAHMKLRFDEIDARFVGANPIDRESERRLGAEDRTTPHEG